MKTTREREIQSISRNKEGVRAKDKIASLTRSNNEKAYIHIYPNVMQKPAQV